MGRGAGVWIDDVTAVGETDKALRCRCADWDDDEWIPKSQITDDSEVWRQGDIGILVVTDWIARERGLD